ncbi:LysR family transcriptional regulator [Chitinophaga pendula]|uniref:LysR family transcriptional regulator n=1 Tax=Chitinophaga TaxID=79328 RepID=UPI000BAE7B7B|nr:MULTISPECIES: LysR family transcriptional regulator [Chitinophaga]ASZ11721.1 hypothetical protein CK934_12520 [Chitinophaga sp. MD30]UCJ05259.1 LysR family transcriptional regulator [Chitinophaga pendula]
MIETKDIQLITAIIQEGSITNAAEKMYLSQSALSHQLRDLETRTGIKMFERVNKKMIPTPAAGKIWRSAQDILPLLARLNDDITAIRQGKTHTLRISTECYTCYHWLPPIITRLKAANNNIDIQIIANATADPLSFLLNGKLDIALISDKPTHTGIHLTPLFNDHNVAILSQHHPFANSRKSLTAADLAGEHLIAYETKTADGLQLRAFFGDTPPKNISRVQLTEAIIEMINANMGIGIMANWAVKPYLQTKEIITLPIRPALAKRAWKAAFIDKTNPIIPKLISEIKTHFSTTANNK